MTGRLLDRPGREVVKVFLEEEYTDSDGNLMTRASLTGITTTATVQFAAASGTSARRAEQDNEGFETEATYNIRFPRSFPYTLGAQSKIEWQGKMSRCSVTLTTTTAPTVQRTSGTP